MDSLFSTYVSNAACFSSACSITCLGLTSTFLRLYSLVSLPDSYAMGPTVVPLCPCPAHAMELDHRRKSYSLVLWPVRVISLSSQLCVYKAAQCIRIACQPVKLVSCQLNLHPVSGPEAGLAFGILNQFRNFWVGCPLMGFNSDWSWVHPTLGLFEDMIPFKQVLEAKASPWPLKVPQLSFWGFGHSPIRIQLGRIKNPTIQNLQLLNGWNSDSTLLKSCPGCNGWPFHHLIPQCMFKKKISREVGKKKLVSSKEYIIFFQNSIPCQVSRTKTKRKKNLQLR